jgi:hypothetical protein
MSEQPTPFAGIFAEDDTLGLLAPKSVVPTRSGEQEIIIAQFLAINAFMDAHGVEPGSTENGRNPDLSECTLEGNLEAFRGDDELRRVLSPYDRHRLLRAASLGAPIPTTVDEILASEDPLLCGPADEIFVLRHVANPAIEKVNAPTEIAKRRPCPDFERFAPLFAELKADLESGSRVSKRFERETSVVPGSSFLLNGILSYVADVDDVQRRRNDKETRIRVIFDNGMEGNHLLRSFARMLYEDENGLQIVESAPRVNGPLFGGVGHVSGPLFTGQPDKDEFGEVRGTVYIVESLSEDPDIVALRGRLFKIGFTTLAIESRLADAEKDPTFLCAKVRLRATYETNFSPRKLEQLLHQFFAHANLQIEVALGRRVVPKEWFVVPLDLVEEAVTRILDRSIVNYRYDAVSRKILPR